MFRTSVYKSTFSYDNYYWQGGCKKTQQCKWHLIQKKENLTWDQKSLRAFFHTPLWQLKLFRSSHMFLTCNFNQNRQTCSCRITWNFNYGHFQKALKTLLIDTSCLSCVQCIHTSNSSTEFTFGEIQRVISFSWLLKINDLITEKPDQPFLAEAQVKMRQEKTGKCTLDGICQSHQNYVCSFTEYFPFAIFRCSAA